MARNIPVTNIAHALEQRIIDKIKMYSPDNPKMNEALLRIGARLESDIKLNIQRNRMIDTGTLLNSIAYKLDKKDDKTILQVGSFGVPYARMHEFGGPFLAHQRRAMFASLRNRGKLQRNYTPKNVIQGNTFKARPYIRPAWDKNKNYIMDVLRSLIKQE